MYGQSENVPIYAFPDNMQLPHEFAESSKVRTRRNALPTKGLQLKTRSFEIQMPKLIPPQDRILGGIFEPKNRLIAKETKIVTRNADQQDFIDNIKSKWNLVDLKRAEKDTEKQMKPIQPFKIKLPEISNKKIIDLPFLKLNEKKIVTRDIKNDEYQKPGNSPCGYSYESCDPKVHNKEGCPLCYKCSCEPAKGLPANARFSPNDIRIPYQIVEQKDAPAIVPTAQEFDYEPKTYVGFASPDLYNKYIKQIISKYPDHMARNLPNIQEQEKDLLNFINELSKSKTPHEVVPNEDIRYKLIDNAMDMYKQYERAINALPKSGKPLKRESLLEVIPLDDAGKSYAIPRNEFDE